jgi:hypothetical protein
MSRECGCRNCNIVHEHVASLLPFKVLEAVADKPLGIAGVAMVAGMSRNFNVYTVEELEAFAPLLVGAPVYIEHVAVDSAAGKVTKCTYDSVSRCLLYEAEIYDSVIAEKIRNGLIQHVSVGADYDALDVVDAKIPHGLSHPELSLVAVPGIPETNIQVLEHLRESLARTKGVVKEAVREQDMVFCVFCNKPADYFVSICENCFGELVSDISVPLNSKNEVQEQHVHFAGVKKMEEKDIDKIAEKVALKIGELNSLESEKLKTELIEAQKKVLEAEDKVKIAQDAHEEANNKLTVATKTVEDLKKLMPGVDLLANPPVLMPVAEHIAVLEKHLPSVMAERSSLGLQRHAQEMRGSIMQAKEKLSAK